MNEGALLNIGALMKIALWKNKMQTIILMKYQTCLYSNNKQNNKTPHLPSLCLDGSKDKTKIKLNSQTSFKMHKIQHCKLRDFYKTRINWCLSTANLTWNRIIFIWRIWKQKMMLI